MESISDILQGELEPGPTEITTGQYRAYLRAKGLSQSTQENYLKWIRKLEDMIGRAPSKWDRKVLKGLEMDERWVGFSTSSRGIGRSALRRLWEAADRDDLLMYRPFWSERGSDANKRAYTETHTASPNEVSVLRQHCRDMIKGSRSSQEVNRCCLMLLIANTGIRSYAAANLRLGDLNIEDETLYIARDKRDTTRKIPINDLPIKDEWARFIMARDRTILALIEKYKDNTETVARLEGLKVKGSPLFFRRHGGPGEVGKPWDSRTVQSIIASITRDVLDRERRPHSFRHSRATELLALGWRIERVTFYMGWESPTMAYRYLNLGMDDMREEIERTKGN